MLVSTGLNWTIVTFVKMLSVEIAKWEANVALMVDASSSADSAVGGDGLGESVRRVIGELAPKARVRM